MNRVLRRDVVALGDIALGLACHDIMINFFLCTTIVSVLVIRFSLVFHLIIAFIARPRRAASVRQNRRRSVVYRALVFVVALSSSVGRTRDRKGYRSNMVRPCWICTMRITEHNWVVTLLHWRDRFILLVWILNIWSLRCKTSIRVLDLG